MTIYVLLKQKIYLKSISCECEFIPMVYAYLKGSIQNRHRAPKLVNNHLIVTHKRACLVKCSCGEFI
jgi:hypothetical protein